MKDVPIDPRIEKLIASLYGELPDDEERELKALLAEDATLRAEWDELVATRGLLRGWEIEETAPSFVLVGGEEAARERGGSARARRADHAPATPAGFWARLRAQILRPLPVPAVAFAVALALLAALALGRFRVERLERGLALRFGDSTPAQMASSGKSSSPSAASSATPATAATDTPPRGVADAVPASSSTGSGTAAESPYITRQEFDAFSSGMAKMVVSALNDYRDRSEQQMSRAMFSLYQDLNQKNNVAYGDLRDRIDAVGVGLLVEQTKSDARLEDLIDQKRGEPLTPLNQTTNPGTEEK